MFILVRPSHSLEGKAFRTLRASAARIQDSSRVARTMLAPYGDRNSDFRRVPPYVTARASVVGGNSGALAVGVSASLQRRSLVTVVPTQFEASRFQYHYDNTLSHDLAEKLGVTNAYQIPKLKKIILSSSVSFKPQQMRGSDLGSRYAEGSGLQGTSNSKGSNKRPGLSGQGLQDCTSQVRKALILLSGQSLNPKTFRVGRPHLGIREGRLAAYQVTLRDETMYSFLERLLTEVIPKVMKTDLATLVTGSSDRRLQQSSMKLSNFEIPPVKRIFDTA